MNFNYKEFYNIIKESGLDAFKWSPFKWILTIGLGLIIGFLPMGKELFEWDTKTSLITVGISLLVLYFFRFLLLSVKNSIKYFHRVYKESVYGDAIILLKDSFSEAHYYRKTPGFQEKDFMNSMIIFCDNLKTVYDKITNSNCSVSIKVPVEDSKVSEKTLLKNLSRNVSHKKRDTDLYSNTEHTIIGNSPFNNCLNKVITNQKEKFYINNDIKNSTNYLNSSISCYEKNSLPYSSELVHPITPMKTNDNSNYDCHGFICIDSDKVNVFDYKYAPAIIEGVADGIYDIIEQLNSETNARN